MPKHRRIRVAIVVASIDILGGQAIQALSLEELEAQLATNVARMQSLLPTAAASERRFCAEKCSSGGDCRGAYSCQAAGTYGSHVFQDANSGTTTINDGPRRVTRMCDTRSFVLQLAPKSPVTICFRKMPSCTQYG